jgi:hypothetical protein
MAPVILETPPAAPARIDEVPWITPNPSLGLKLRDLKPFPICFPIF